MKIDIWQAYDAAFIFIAYILERFKNILGYKMSTNEILRTYAYFSISLFFVVFNGKSNTNQCK